MQINSNDEIAGIAIVKIRDFLKRARHGIWDVSYLDKMLGLNKIKAKNVLNTLNKEGYIEKYEKTGKIQYWRTTLKGNTLSLASAAKPIHRKTADKKLKDFLGRVRQVNSDDYFLYKVSKVLVFGSYLSSADRLGDIDIAYELAPKEKDPNKQEELEKKRRSEARNKGKNFNSFMDELFWPQVETLKFLKSHSRSISLHPIEDGILKNTPSKLLYEAKETG